MAVTIIMCCFLVYTISQQNTKVSSLSPFFFTHLSLKQGLLVWCWCRDTQAFILFSSEHVLVPRLNSTACNFVLSRRRELKGKLKLEETSSKHFLIIMEQERWTELNRTQPKLFCGAVSSLLDWIGCALLCSYSDGYDRIQISVGFRFLGMLSSM